MTKCITHLRTSIRELQEAVAALAFEVKYEANTETVQNLMQALDLMVAEYVRLQYRYRDEYGSSLE